MLMKISLEIVDYEVRKWGNYIMKVRDLIAN